MAIRDHPRAAAQEPLASSSSPTSTSSPCSTASDLAGRGKDEGNVVSVVASGMIYCAPHIGE
ncbi:hypothetical protein E2562_037827 [Oryza meyeriana var. granulata]|uniref:Uncharacterized protein n=1 Tax=Oryza meyeriana var. granulata TaxID=110450 RepID=A0A6G1DTE1_9ORYZ|nr:hypothetical protein E2562_037827 [Oryza meyeriana var. granulata]